MNKKEIIGTCTYMGGVPMVFEEFSWCWGQLIQFNTESLCGPNQLIHYARPKVSLHDFARNQMAATFLGDWLFMLDTDHSFDPDILLRLLNKMTMYDLDIISGAYTFKVPPYLPVCYLSSDSGYNIIGKWDENVDLLSIDSAGAGCLLIRRRVFDKIRDELGELPFERFNGLGEDHSFFKRCEKLGIKSYLHTKAECHHLEIRRTHLSDCDTSNMQLSDKIVR